MLSSLSNCDVRYVLLFHSVIIINSEIFQFTNQYLAVNEMF
jgi:hypothetical protein